jgi:hypothetical protein
VPQLSAVGKIEYALHISDGLVPIVGNIKAQTKIAFDLGYPRALSRNGHTVKSISAFCVARWHAYKTHDKHERYQNTWQ